MKHFKLILVLLLTIFSFSGFWSGKTKQEQIDERLKIRENTLIDLFKYAPQSKVILEKSYGYAVFSNVGINLVLFSAEGGVGVAKDNETGKNIYMNMASGGVGFGLGIKDFRAIFLFENKKVYDNFVEYGWEANVQADAAIKLNEKGEAINAAITVAPGIRLYKMTKSGLALQATIQGTKYWKDEDLN
jgi:lipid-binding SYLF domain-containing protein